MNDNVRKQIDSGALTTGILLIGVGVIFLLDRLGFASFDNLIHNWWPMIVVGLGVRKLLTPGKSAWGGLWMIAIGCWLQLAHFHTFGLSYNSSWPLLLIVLGAGMIARTIFAPSRRNEPASPEEHRGA